MYLKVGTALISALHCTCGRCYQHLGDRNSSVTQKVQVPSNSQVPVTNLNVCNVPQSLSPLFWQPGSPENSPGWGTLTLVCCPQLILCLCRFLDLHGILQAGGLGGMTGHWDEERFFPCHSCRRDMDASLCHQKSARALCCSHPGLMPAVNFTALPVHPPRGASRTGRGRAAGVVPEECGLLKRSCEGTGWPRWPGDHLLALVPCRLRAELHVPSAVWSVGSRAGEWADSRHPSCFVSLLFNRLLYKRLVVCFTQ